MNNANAGLKLPGQLIIYSGVCVYMFVCVENIITGSMTPRGDNNNCVKRKKISFRVIFFQNVFYLLC